MISWISTASLDEKIEHMLARVRGSRDNALSRRAVNSVDPFSSLMIATAFGLTTSQELENVQDAEAAMRGFSNALGAFHQSVLGAVDGWVNHDAGYDLECADKQIIAEVKNKHNTMNASNRLKVIEDLTTAIRQKRENWKAYLVQIIPKHPERFKKRLGARSVYEVDGASFYHLVTGDPNAIHDLFDYLCKSLTVPQEITQHCLQIMRNNIPSKNQLQLANLNSPKADLPRVNGQNQ